SRCRPREGGTHNHQGFGYRWLDHMALLRRMGPRLRGDDSRESLLHILFRGNERRLVQRRCKLGFPTRYPFFCSGWHWVWRSLATFGAGFCSAFCSALFASTFCSVFGATLTSLFSLGAVSPRPRRASPTGETAVSDNVH